MFAKNILKLTDAYREKNEKSNNQGDVAMFVFVCLPPSCKEQTISPKIRVLYKFMCFQEDESIKMKIKFGFVTAERMKMYFDLLIDSVSTRRRSIHKCMRCVVINNFVNSIH